MEHGEDGVKKIPRPPCSNKNRTTPKCRRMCCRPQYKRRSVDRNQTQLVMWNTSKGFGPDE